MLQQNLVSTFPSGTVSLASLAFYLIRAKNDTAEWGEHCGPLQSSRGRGRAAPEHRGVRGTGPPQSLAQGWARRGAGGPLGGSRALGTARAARSGHGCDLFPPPVPPHPGSACSSPAGRSGAARTPLLRPGNPEVLRAAFAEATLENADSSRQGCPAPKRAVLVLDPLEKKKRCPEQVGRCYGEACLLLNAW